MTMSGYNSHSVTSAIILLITTVDLWAPRSFVSAGYGYSGTGTSQCERDGFYYHDATSITICSMGNQFLQHCPFGTKNKEVNHYNSGKSYGYAEFCSVNLNDYGAGASRKHSGGNYYQEAVDYRAYRQPTHHASGGYGHGGYGGGGHGGYGHGGSGIQPATQYGYAHFPAFHKIPYH